MTDRELKVGDRIKDNDPRMHMRILTVERMDDTHVWAVDRSVTARILRRRIYTDGKPRRTGFSLVWSTK